MIEKPRRIVIDTNVFISAYLSPTSTAHRSVRRAFETGVVLASFETVQEMKTVISRAKFNRVRTLAARENFLAIYLNLLEPVSPENTPAVISDCRDSKDAIILALALPGQADFIITGDDDLLSLNPWRGIPILTPAAYLALTS